jgi:DNA ligase D-like protein (predicted 3'-phosphoesterase)
MTPTPPPPSARSAIRVVVRGAVQGVGFRDATARRARSLALMGWVRNRDDGAVEVHAEGPPPALESLVAFLERGPRLARVSKAVVERVRPEGHEQFAIRGVPAGLFVVQQHDQRGRRHFDLRLEVDGVLRSWALPKGPSMDPAIKRLAVQVPDHTLEHLSFEGSLPEGRVSIWDRGAYEQGGRVEWPEALARGHAVFVLDGQRLRGGFALQRTRPAEGGAASGAQWLLIKRRDEHARPGSDVVAEAPGEAGEAAGG